MNIINNKYTYKPLNKYVHWNGVSKLSNNILEDVYKSLRDSDTIEIRIPISDCFYAKAAIYKNLNIDISVYDVENLLLTEGMLPYKNYDIPDWYARKWLVNGEKLQTYSSRSIIYKTAKEL